MRCLLTFLLLLSYSAAFTCYNEYYALDAKGHFHQVDIGEIRFQKNFDQHKIERKLIQLEEKLHTKADFKLLSDYGLYLVKGGKVKEARILFEALAKAYPNEYSIIANLGTTYELLGENEKALEYIRKGLKINPNSHGGSEWIHVKILLAKIALNKDPDYLKNTTVLNLSPKQESSEAIRKQLYIQLKERFPFCKGPDPIMADLFIDLGDSYAETLSFEHAKGLYQIAKKYYHTDRSDADEKIERVRKLREEYAHLSPDKHYSEDEIKMGMVSKIGGIPYTSYLENPNSDNYAIDWTKIEVNPDTLLNYIGLERIAEEVINPESVQVKETPKEKGKATKQAKKSDNSMLWIGLTLTVLIVSIFTYFRSKRK
jgi:tetratricopeptide (TPR) repeat protein